MARISGLVLVTAITIGWIFSAQAQDSVKDAPRFVQAETVVKDTKGRTLAGAFCAVFPDYGTPHSFVTTSSGHAVLVGKGGAAVMCVKDRQAFEVKFPSGNPSQVLLKPLPGEGCHIYNMLPAGSSIAACGLDTGCEWTGWGPAGWCKEIPKPM